MLIITCEYLISSFDIFTMYYCGGPSSSQCMLSSYYVKRKSFARHNTTASSVTTWLGQFSPVGANKCMCTYQHPISS